MSSHYIAQCDSCKYREEFGDPLRLYRLTDGRTLGVERTFIWCNECNAIRWGEDLAELDQLEQDLVAAESKTVDVLGELAEEIRLGKLVAGNLKSPTIEELLSKRLRALRERIRIGAGAG